jgi:beta-glucosidase
MKLGAVIGRIAIPAMVGLALTGCAAAQTQPLQASAPAATEDAVVADLVSRMSLERKIAQLIQPQINSFTAADMEQYRFGSYLNGGNGGPGGEEFAPASAWLALADEMYDASMQPLPNGEPAIPTIWGTDAVHGHTNIVGATIFPHNIALGAAGDADLVRRIGAATAVEIEVTGIDWNFSPTVAVAQDDRWGRTYESYSENPDLVAELGAALVEGLQGDPDSADYLGAGRVIATAKHFFGDGGTENGVDQGDVNGDLAELLDLHGRPYPVAIEAGVETVMASFNSINGRKMHGNRDLLTDILRGEMGFDGLVVGDWNGHGQVADCEVDDCPQSLLAGLDIYMVPDDWRALMDSLIAQVNDGTIPMERVDEAVTRVLRVKYRAGLLGDTARRPSERANAGRYELLASPDHRAIAREAVARSQVVLSNDGVLPLAPGSNVLVAGSAADNIGQAAGGWTLTWQGGRELDRDLFPNATSIWEGLRDAVTANGGAATLSEDGSFESRPDVAVVVFGEPPYAEFAGDQRDMVLRDEEGLTLLRSFREQGIPAVAIFLSGRPMWMNREINAANAFVASWLPGSEGGGIADVLTGARSATGRLSFSWPGDCAGDPVNTADGALFAYGYGRSLDDVSPLAPLHEECAALAEFDSSELFASGRLAPGVAAYAGGAEELAQLRGQSSDGLVSARGYDRNAQEDAREITMLAGSSLAIVQNTGSRNAYRITYEVVNRPTAPMTLLVGDRGSEPSSIDITQHFAHAFEKGWREMVVTEACAPRIGSGIGFQTEGEITFRIASVQRDDLPEGTECSF